MSCPGKGDSEPTRLTPRGLHFEQCCTRCEAYRHHFTRDITSKGIIWRPGKHPNRYGIKPIKNHEDQTPHLGH